MYWYLYARRLSMITSGDQGGQSHDAIFTLRSICCISDLHMIILVKKNSAAQPFNLPLFQRGLVAELFVYCNTIWDQSHFLNSDSIQIAPVLQ